MSSVELTRRKAVAALGALGLLSACGQRRTAERYDAIVVGAGISGLYAATLLEELGLNTLVLEASGRVGGRMMTLDHLPGAPECGGQTLGPMYARVLNLVQRFGLEVFERKSLFSGNAYFLDGTLCSADRALLALSGSGLSEEERAILPNKLYPHYINATNPLSDLYEWRDSQHRGYDDISIASSFRQASASPAALSLMENWFDGAGMNNMSALFAYRKAEAAELETRRFRIRGGSTRLPEAMAAGLRREVRLNHRVVSLSYDKNGATVGTDLGTSYQAKHVFVSVPFSLLRDVRFDPGLPGSLQTAVETLPYNNITQVKVAFRSKFWELDGLPPAMFADTIAERVTATPGQDGTLHYLNVWIKGARAALMDRYDNDEIGQRVVAELERMRPAARGKLVAAHVHSWGKFPYSRGAYHFFGLGGMRRYGGALVKPHGPIHWIGEHAASLQQGMEGACESAENAVFGMINEA